jgi:uncharacterized membrane protein YheB (UPF0754 family)
MDFNYIVTPIVSGVIGYITNDLAIRMLLRPYRPWTVFGRRVPLTPGLLPKEQGRIAESVGGMIEQQFLSERILTELLLAPPMREKIEMAVDGLIERLKADDRLVQCALEARVAPEEIEQARLGLRRAVAQKVAEALPDMNVGGAVVNAVFDKLLKQNDGIRGLGRALNIDALIDGFKENLGGKINALVIENAPRIVSESVDAEVCKLMMMPIGDVARQFEDQIQYVRDRLIENYNGMIRSALRMAFSMIDISAIVKDRIMELNPRELEALLMDLMKRELSAIIWLGALLGTILGFASAFLSSVL